VWSMPPGASALAATRITDVRHVVETGYVTFHTLQGPACGPYAGRCTHATGGSALAMRCLLVKRGAELIACMTTYINLSLWTPQLPCSSKCFVPCVPHELIPLGSPACPRSDGLLRGRPSGCQLNMWTPCATLSCKFLSYCPFNVDAYRRLSQALSITGLK